MSLNTTGPRVTQRTGKILLVFLMVVMVVGIVIAAFSQTLPQLTVQGQSVFASGCSPLVEEGAITAGSGIVMYDCSGKPAFTISNIAFTGPVTFKIPTSNSTITTNLGVTTGTSCTSFIQLTNNTQTTLQVGGYSYCLTYGNIPVTGGTIGPITVTWE